MKSAIHTALSIMAAILIGFALTFLVIGKGKQPNSAQSPVASLTHETAPDQNESIKEPRSRDEHPRRGNPELRRRTH